MKFGAKKLGWYLLILVFFCVFYLGVRLSIAEYYQAKAKATYKPITLTEKLADNHLLLSALYFINKSIKFNPYNAEAYDYKAYLLMEVWRFDPDWPYPSGSKRLNSVLENHYTALMYRPNWPYSSVSIAQIASLDPILQPQFYEAFDHAYDFGRYDKNIAFWLMQLGLSRWSHLNEKYRSKVIDVTYLSLMQKSNSPLDIKQLLVEANLLIAICSKIDSSVRKQQMCF